MDMFAACYYHCDRVLHLFGDVETNPGPQSFAQHVKLVFILEECFVSAAIHLKEVVLRKHWKFMKVMP